MIPRSTGREYVLLHRVDASPSPGRRLNNYDLAGRFTVEELIESLEREVSR